MDANSFEELIKQADEALKAGRGDLVASKVSSLTLSTVPLEFRLPLATICRRAGLFDDGLKLLTPLIHADKNKWRSEASEAERAEYAVLLTKYGSVGEGLQILQSLPADRLPDVYLYRAFSQMAQWNYREAVSELRLYLATGPPEYSVLIANVNLSASLIAIDGLDEARALLDQNIEICSERGFNRLLANSFELRGQVFLQRKEWALCRADIENSASILRAERSSDQLFIQKWKAALEAFETHSLTPLSAARAEARKRKHWESVRDLDRISLLIEFDDEIFHHLIFGTPFAPFRDRVCGDLGRRPTAETFCKGPAAAPRLVLSTAEITGIDGVESMDKQCLKVMVPLLRDFYRPVRLSELFSALFPDQHFDIFSSPNRVQQAIRRARQWLRKNALPVEIEFADGTYSLTQSAPFAYAVPLIRGGDVDTVAEKLRSTFASEAFSASEAASATGLSRQQFQRWFTNAEGSQRIEKVFAGSATRYRMTDRKPAAA